MSHLLKPLLFLLAMTLIANPTIAEDYGSKDEAVAMVKRTVESIKTSGLEKTVADTNNKDPKFIDRDLYSIIYKMDGTCLAHAANPKLAGRDLSRSVDTDGFAYGKERVEKAKTEKSFWIDYKYKNPVSNKIQPKSAYCEVESETIVCVGAYK